MKKVLLLIITLSALYSCNEVMDTRPLSTYTAEDIWGSFDLAEGFIFTCYSNTMGNLNNWREDVLTKEIINAPWGGSYVSEKTEEMDVYTDVGWNNFSNIRAVNLALRELEMAPFSDYQRALLMGEAYFMRSVIYFSLTKRFGGIQIVKEVLEQDANFFIGRSTIKEAYDFVLSDLEMASELLPVENVRGRASKGAAYALTMRVALQAGAFLNDNSYYRKVIETGDKLFALGKYSLDSYSNLFNAYSSAVVSPENILLHERSAINTTFEGTPMQSLVPNSDNSTEKLSTIALVLYPLVESFEGWMNHAPTQDLVDNYLVTDADGKEKRWDQTSYITSKLTVREKMYTKRDNRFYATIVYDSTKYFNNWVYTRKHGNASNNVFPIYGGNINEGTTSTGYLFKKYVYEDKKLWYSDRVDFCYSLLRLGEAYLNYAEAALLLGDETTARTYITKTYQGHGGFSNTITASGDALWEAYKRERTIEMILECGDRYNSLLRWGMQKTGGLVSGYENSGYVIPELNGQFTGIAIDSLGFNYQLFNLNERNNLPMKFSPKRYLFPVPQGKIDANPALTQNPGWN